MGELCRWTLACVRVGAASRDRGRRWRVAGACAVPVAPSDGRARVLVGHVLAIFCGRCCSDRWCRGLVPPPLYTSARSCSCQLATVARRRRRRSLTWCDVSNMTHRRLAVALPTYAQRRVRVELQCAIVYIAAPLSAIGHPHTYTRPHRDGRLYAYVRNRTDRTYVCAQRTYSRAFRALCMYVTRVRATCRVRVCVRACVHMYAGSRRCRCVSSHARSRRRQCTCMSVVGVRMYLRTCPRASVYV